MARGVATALAGAVACALLALTVWGAVFHVELAQRADSAVLHRLGEAAGAAAPIAARVARLANPLPYALLFAGLLAFALRTRGVRGVVVAGATVAVANLVTQYLKPALATPRPFLYPGDLVHPASWPSGHATAAAALALAAILVAPAGRRALLTAAGSLYALVVAGSVVLAGWHLPSDVLGGFAVAGCAACLGAAALRPTRPPSPAPA